MTNPFTALREFYEQNPKSVAVKAFEDKWDALVAAKDRKALLQASDIFVSAMDRWETEEQDVKDEVFDAVTKQLEASGIPMERDDA